MAYYESIIVIRPDLTTEQIESVTKRINEIITNNNGKILQTELWGRRQLAYTVKKTNKGYYVFNILEGGGPMIATLEGLLMIDEDILKFMNIRVNKPVLDPTPLAPNAEAPAPAVASEIDAEIDAFESAADDEVVDEEIEVV
ncbi:MAG: 30S ribosomal protein S6, partial [Magnetococcales bacterium]|nr:30S ribosomal protein S6 [Magnetococcales bacterium]